MPKVTRDPTKRSDGTWWDKAEIGYKSYYCYNPNCPDNKWPGGHYKFVPEGHFNDNGECVSIAKNLVPR